jgi:hypothetical protein
MLVNGRELLAVSDRGSLMRLRLAAGERVLRPVAGEMTPLREGGRPLEGSGRDAEALARTASGLAVAFERDHRIVLLGGGLPDRTVRHPRLERLVHNAGLEALATLPDGRLIAVTEESEGGAFPVFLLGQDGALAEASLPRMGPHLVTGADIGPDGQLYLVRRDFSLLRGISIRIERYRLGPDGFPRPDTRETLAEFENGSGIDNMEAIALWQDGPSIRLAIASDDNFNLLQRTLLVDFEVLE